MTTMLTIDHASLTYSHASIFANLSLKIPVGQWVAILGPSGIGKTSLLKMIAGLLDSHEVKTSSHLTTNISTEDIAYLPQQDLLLPWLNVLDNVLLKLKIRASTRHMKQKAEEEALSLLTNFGLEHALTLYPHQLSGGMRQRVALARTLLEEKPIILMDEPFAALDTLTRYRLQALAVSALKDKTVLFITHDPLEALRLAHGIYLMEGSPANLRKIGELSSERPRNLTDPALMTMQGTLVDELMGYAS